MIILFVGICLFACVFHMAMAYTSYKNTKHAYKEKETKWVAINFVSCVWFIGMFVYTLWVIQQTI